jgi:hypothetical protein
MSQIEVIRSLTKGEGTKYDVILSVCNGSGRLNISKNDLGEVEMASEGSDMTNSP